LAEVEETARNCSLPDEPCSFGREIAVQRLAPPQGSVDEQVLAHRYTVIFAASILSPAASSGATWRGPCAVRMGPSGPSGSTRRGPGGSGTSAGIAVDALGPVRVCSPRSRTA